MITLHIYEEYKVIELSGNDTLSGITIRKMAGEETIPFPVQGVFIAIGFQPNSSLLSRLVELNDSGEIVIHPDCSTSYRDIRGRRHYQRLREEDHCASGERRRVSSRRGNTFGSEKEKRAAVCG
jgi:hypothetical protein